MMKIAAFDFFDTNDAVNAALNLEPISPVSENFNRLGFESQYFINNLGTLFIWPVIMIFLFVFFLILNRYT